MGVSQPVSGHKKACQASKIKELKLALRDAGLRALGQQAKALGLCRSTTWAILSGNHKASGLSGRIIVQMLAGPDLPPIVRGKILDYVREKYEGAYGHNTRQLRRFRAYISKHLGEPNLLPPCRLPGPGAPPDSPGG